MLVLSRKAKQKIQFANLGINVEVLKIVGSNVRLGIDAPKHVRVLRSELADEKSSCPANTELPISHDREVLFRTRVLTALKSLHDLQSGPFAEEISLENATFEKVVKELQLLDDELADAGSNLELPAQVQKRPKALVVDDNCNEAELLAGFMRCREFDVTTASDGAKAIKLLSENELPDCVLLDMNMPQFNGRWTIEKIRRNNELADLKVFALSGLAPTEYGVEIGPSGIDHWFQKPVDPETLVTQLGLAISGQDLAISA